MRQQDDRGRIGLRADPEWVLDHAFATYALAESFRLCGSDVSTQTVAAVDALRELVATRQPVAGVEVRLWADMIERSLRAGMAARPTAGGEARASAAERALDRLAASVAALPDAEPESARERAASFLRSVLRGGTSRPTAWTTWLDEPLADPMAAWYALVASEHLGGIGHLTASEAVKNALERARTKRGEHQDSFEPKGGSGAANGRLGTTAMAILLMQVCYRFCGLDVCRELEK